MIIEDNDWYLTPADWATDYDCFINTFKDIIVDDNKTIRTSLQGSNL